MTQASPTAAQLRIVAVLEYFEALRVRPFLREIAAKAGLKAKSTVCVHLQTLEQLGWLRRDYRDPACLEFRIAVPPSSANRKDRQAFFALAGLKAQLQRTPRYDEIAEALNVSAKSTAHERVKRVVEAGWIEIDYMDEHVFELVR